MQEAEGQEEQPTPTGSPEGLQEENTFVAWGPVPTFVVDAALGNVNSGGIVRLTLAEFILNPTHGATRPMVRPTVTLAITQAGIRNLITQLNDLVEPEPNA